MHKITEITRRDIIDLLLDGIRENNDNIKFNFYGRLSEVEFLERIFDLENLPSTDRRFNNAKADILFHCYNEDWPSEWLFKDQRLNLMNNDEKFLDFLTLIFHPAVRIENGPWIFFLQKINKLLNADGFELYEKEKISERSVYGYKKLDIKNNKIKLKKGSEIRCNGIVYTVKNQYKQGSDARLFDVEDENGNILLMKVIIKDEKIKKDKIQRFENEMNFLYKQNHNNIVKVIGFGFDEEKTMLFYIMPKYTCDLRELIDNGISKDKILDYFWQICEGVKNAHNQQCWHRDLKPENILYDMENDMLVVADFGIAHFNEFDNIAMVETTTNDRLANFRYHAPEQKKGMNVTSPTADIWALGLILNEMFTKELAIGENYPVISEFCTKYKELDEVVRCMLKSRPEDRIQSITEVQMLIIRMLYDKISDTIITYIKNELLINLKNPSILLIKNFISNNKIRNDIMFVIQQFANTNIYISYIYFLNLVFDYIFSTKNNFNQYTESLILLIDIIKDNKLIHRIDIYILFICEQLNKIAYYISESKSKKQVGKAWKATNIWFDNYQNIPRENLEMIKYISQFYSLNENVKIINNILNDIS